MSRLLNLLAAGSRVLVLALAAVFTFIVLLLAQSSLAADAVTWPIKAGLVAMAAISLVRPRDGLLIVAGIAPFAQLAARILGSEIRGAEAVVLACLSGALLHAWWSGRIRRFPADRLETATFVLALVIAASCIEQLWFLQVQRNFPAEFFADLAGYARREYIWTFRGFAMIFNAMLLLEGLALIIWTIDACRRDLAFRMRLLGMLVFAAVCAALIIPAFAIQQFIETGLSTSDFWEYLLRRRWSVHVGDVNAAASFFALMAFLALGVAIAYGRRGIAWWLAGGVIVVGGVWLTASRTAFIAVMAVLTVLLAQKFFWKMAQHRIRAVVLTVLLTAPVWLGGAAYFLWFRSEGNFAMGVRWLFLQTTLRMVADHPLFGVGIGQYALWSWHYAPRILTVIYPKRENAHNNFSQVAGEMGLAGLIPFLGVLALALWEGKRTARTDPIMRACLFGVVTFLITCLGGHPLLVAAVAYPFWMLVGIVAAGGVPMPQPETARASTTLRRPALSVAFALILLAASLPVRVDGRIETLDWSRVSYGFYDWEKGPSGESFRWTGPRARFFVAGDTTSIVIPLRANAVSRENPLKVDIFVDDRSAGTVQLQDLRWQTVEVDVAARGRPHHVDVAPSRSWIPADIFKGSTDRRRLGVQVGQIKVEPAAPDAGSGD